MTPLTRLRKKLKDNNLSGFWIPHHDRYQGEYLVPGDEVLLWLTGFSGSAGVCIVLGDKACLFVDGRYTLQARAQVDPNLFYIEPLGHELTWLKVNSTPTDRIGFDPWNVTERDVEALLKNAPMAEAKSDFLDDLWHDRPPHPATPVFQHSIEWAGWEFLEKIAFIRECIAEKGLDAYLFGPESWSWLLNVRGGDLAYTPLSQGFLWLTHTECHLFLYTTDVPQVLMPHVHVHPIVQLEDFLHQHKHVHLGYDRDQTPYTAIKLFENKTAFRDPCTIPRATKNEVEGAGAKKAHIRDGIAWCMFWYELEQTLASGHPLTELDIVDRMLAARSHQPHFHSLSFPTIVGSGPNGAIVHYKPETNTNRTLQNGELLLIDSGSQYGDGTTDITRTLYIGNNKEPTDTMRRHYTLVLKGHIALARMIFPTGTSGAQLDGVARAPLWREGLDYAHGTGHGVGSFLSVHEGPQRISKLGHAAFLSGMIVSNEPGYYEADNYGIRLENLMVVKNAQRGWMAFDTLTLVPFDMRLVNFSILSEDEMAWLRDYHAKVFDTLAPLLPKNVQAWLREKLEMHQSLSG